MKQFTLLTVKQGIALSCCLVLSACVSHTSNRTAVSHTLVCQNAQRYQNLVVGDGQCVSLIKRCSNAPQTSEWRPGKKVLGQAQRIKEGTIIATFKNGKYPNKRGYHAAIYIKQTKEGIWVWDQWVGKPVHKRLIRKRADRAAASNTAQAYRIVQVN